MSAKAAGKKRRDSSILKKTVGMDSLGLLGTRSFTTGGLRLYWRPGDLETQRDLRCTQRSSLPSTLSISGPQQTQNQFKSPC
jgi:hypothetical protein